MGGGGREGASADPLMQLVAGEGVVDLVPHIHRRLDPPERELHGRVLCGHRRGHEAGGVVRHSFTHFDLELCVAVYAGKAAPDGEGEWWPLGDIDKAGLPTLFAKAAQRVLA